MSYQIYNNLETRKSEFYGAPSDRKNTKQIPTTHNKFIIDCEIWEVAVCKMGRFYFLKMEKKLCVCVCVTENNIQGELFDFHIYYAGLLFEVHPIAKVYLYRCKDLQMSILFK